MAFTDFTLDDLEEKFGIKNIEKQIFTNIEPLHPSSRLEEDLALANELPIRSEKAKSESIVFPILVEVRRRNDKYFTIYSGDTLSGDAENGLKGECDFILAKDIKSYTINYPIIHIVEAKRHDIQDGIQQCSAQLVGAQRFNQKKGIGLPKLYGCATTGDEWQFLVLENQTITIDKQKYYLSQINELLGIFQNIVDYYREII